MAVEDLDRNRLPVRAALGAADRNAGLSIGRGDDVVAVDLRHGDGRQRLMHSHALRRRIRVVALLIRQRGLKRIGAVGQRLRLGG